MIDPELLELLRCPVDGSPLRPAEPELVEQLNRLLRDGELRDQNDARVEEPLEAALVNADGSRAYPVRDNIPTLIPGEAIPLDQVARR